MTIISSSVPKFSLSLYYQFRKNFQKIKKNLSTATSDITTTNGSTTLASAVTTTKTSTTVAPVITTTKASTTLAPVITTTKAPTTVVAIG
jgi:hypothetical protein